MSLNAPPRPTRSILAGRSELTIWSLTRVLKRTSPRSALGVRSSPGPARWQECRTGPPRRGAAYYRGATERWPDRSDKEPPWESSTLPPDGLQPYPVSRRDRTRAGWQQTPATTAGAVSPELQSQAPRVER